MKWWCRTTNSPLPSAAAAEVRLASQLTRWDIDILTEAEEIGAPAGGIPPAQRFVRRGAGCGRHHRRVAGDRGLHLGRGHRLQVEDEELAGIEGFDESVAELKRRAEAFLERRDKELDTKRQEMGVEDEVAEIGGFTPTQLVALGEKG